GSFTSSFSGFEPMPLKRKARSMGFPVLLGRISHKKPPETQRLTAGYPIYHYLKYLIYNNILRGNLLIEKCPFYVFLRLLTKTRGGI
ncbi:MAG: hypothetical protein IJL33_05350, partial [Ruminococcus sp.]|nr:hypothetical protein [Ruminococcus sp.]